MRRAADSGGLECSAFWPVRARAVFQVIHLFSDISTGDQSDVEYAEPAKTMNKMMAVFSLDFLNFAPPECVDPDAGFYHKLCIMTSCPFLVPPLIYAYLSVINGDPDAKYKTLSISLQFFELILNSVTTVILQTFDCKRYGHESHLKEQLL